MKQITRIIFFFVILVNLMGVPCFAMAPLLYFSDLVNGPKSGLGDGLGDGAIVTAWGVNLGSVQNSSKIYLKDSAGAIIEMAHTYYWKNADGILPGGPADLYTTHKMQEVAFSIPSAAAVGAGKIYVEVGGEKSNELDFYVRNTGIFRFIKSGGVDSGIGSWQAPWASVIYAVRGNSAGVGDVIYIATSAEYSGRIQYGASAQLDGLANNHIALVTYPNVRFVVNSPTNSGISNYYTQNDWWVFSKLKVKAYSGTIGSSANGRTVGCELTQPDGIEANGQSGAIGCTAGEYNARGTNSANNLKILGNYIHHYGGQSTSNKEHATYFSLRNNFSAVAPEVGWNRLSDNGARFGIHIYDENECGEFLGVFKVHDNYIENQVGAGINIGTQNCSSNVLGFRGSIAVYNNIIASAGKYSPVASTGHAIMLYGQRNYMQVKIYNNTIYGYGHSSNSTNDAMVIWYEPGSINNFDGTVELINNIFVDTAGYRYTALTKERAPDIYNNNLWFSTTNPSALLPAWDVGALSADPLFVNASAADFHLQRTGPAIDSGSSVPQTLVSRDFFGVLRIGSMDLGATEFDTTILPPVIKNVLLY